jgi:hypothetical protein
MGKTRTFRVINNRLQFRCPVCKTRRFSGVPRALRRKNVRCTKCGEVTTCMIDRRARPRTLQGGKLLMVTQGGTDLEVRLHDISVDGIGIDMPAKTLRSRNIKEGRQVRFKCSWNPRLINNGSFVVSNIKDQRVGVEKVGR